MFTDKNNKSFKNLIDECKKYIDLQKEYVRLELIEKLTIVISTVILIMLMVVLAIVVLFYLSFSVAYLLEPHVGGLTNSYLILSGIFLVFSLVIYVFRKKLIITPILNFIANLFYNNDSKK